MEGREQPASTAAADTPVLLGPICGVRAWTINSRGRLTGHGEFRWKPDGRHTSAECRIDRFARRRRKGSHRPPGNACSCGLYAWHAWSKNIIDLAQSSQTAYGATVVGLIEAKGEVEVHVDGFRAEHARPIALLVPLGAEPSIRSRINEVAARYDAATIELDWVGLEGLLSWCEEHAPALSKGYVEELHPGTSIADRRTVPQPRVPAPLPRSAPPLHPTLGDLISWRRVVDAIKSAGFFVGYGIGFLILLYLYFVVLLVAVFSVLRLIDALGIVDTGIKW